MATEQRRNSNRLFIVVGVVLGIVAAALAFAFTRNAGTNTTSSGDTGNSTTVLVANVDIAARTPLTAELVTAQPVSSAPADALHSIADITPSQYLAIGVKKGTTITLGILASSAAAVSTTPPPPPLTIDAGMVALSIPTAGSGAGASGDLSAVGYYIHTGDHIDILIDPGNGNVRFGFQDVAILQAGTFSAADAVSAAPSVFIIELPRAQAEQMTLLVGGTTPAKIVKYVLRSRTDYGTAATPKYLPTVGTANNTPPQVAEPNGNKGATPQSLSTLFGP